MTNKLQFFQIAFLLFFLTLHESTSAQIIFSEDWSSSSFATNNWTFPAGQSNWTVGAQYTPNGGAAPNAFFNWNPTVTNYSNELVTPVINATAYAGGSVFLSYKFQLNNYSTATLEQFAVEYKTVGSGSWFLLTNYSNAGVVGTLNWAPTNIVLPGMAGQNFQVRFRPYGPNSFNINGWGVDDIQVLALNPCTGTPAAGTASALPANPCPGDPVTLSLTGASVASGLAYQWQRSTVGPTGPWTNIGTANPLIYNPPAGSTSWYRCIVTCTATGLANTSVASLVAQAFSATLANLTHTAPSCVPGADGSISFSASGGTPPYQYGLNGGVYQTTSTFSYLAAATYTVSVKDANACTITSVYALVPNAPAIAQSSTVNVSCNAGSNGSVNVVGVGGTGSLQYILQPGTITNTTGVFTSLVAGSYTVTVKDMAGCTSSILKVITQPLAASSLSQTACNSYTWAANGATYTSSGVYTYTSLNASGCMNTDTLNLVVNNNSTSTLSQTACNSYTWTSNGATYTSSGVYTYTSLNNSGCVNTATLNLTINHSTSSISSASATSSYTWAASGLTYTSSGIYSYTTINAAGCDSIMSLNLTIYQSAVNMTLQNVVQISPSVFEYDIMLTNAGNTALALKGYSCGINHAAGMRNGGTLTHTFVSRDPSLAAIPNPVAGYTSSTNHLRITAANTTNGNEINLSPGFPVRIATMRVSNSVPFPADFIPSLALQTLTAVGKTACIANCIVTPPGTLYSINGVGNTPATGFIQGLTGVVNTPCLYLNKTANFAASMSQSSPVSCYGQSDGVAQISSSGAGSSSSGMYSINGGAMTAYSSNPFTISNLAAATYTVALTSSNGCVASSTSTITQPSLPTIITSVAACNSYTWQGVTYTASGSATNTFISAAGCDSIHTKNFLINNSYDTSSSLAACGSYSWNGTSYTTSGTYIQTYTRSTGCDSTLTLNLTVNPIPSPSISASGPLTFCDGMSIVLNANAGSGLTYQWKKNGISILGATSNAYTASQSGSYTVEETNSSNCSAVSSPQVVTVNNCNVSLQLKLFIQGYYDQASTMLPVLLNQLASTDNTLTDTILVELHNALYPFNLALSKKAVLHTNGSAVCTFNYVNGNYYLGNLYYVAIRHRNGLLTWSADPIAFDSTTVVYDFSSSSSKAYGDNMLEVDPGVWAMYSADLNQDQNVDLLDMPILEADIADYMFGYAATDLNGDGNTDLLDVIYMDYGIANYLFSIYPVAATLPTVITNAISNFTYTTASSGGIIINEGGAVVSARGVCWSTSTNPTVSLSTKTIDGIGSGSFSSSISGLTPSTTYYVRAYATNSEGTAYGNQVVFTTTAFTLATLTTTAISNINYTTASSGGSISNNGGAAITARGVCWSTLPNPTVSLSTKTIDGIGSGPFSSNITGLVAGTTYYVRAYATNSVGTSYGNEVVFTTTSAPLAIGQSYQGGVIAYILQPGDVGYVAGETKGLLAASSDQGFAQWGCYGTTITGADGTAYGAGNQNTNDIKDGCLTLGIAAIICSDLELNGYSDWYLPSKDELIKLYSVRASIGGFAYNYYWTSSEYDAYQAWELSFMDGLFSTYNKSGSPLVRAVRSFSSLNTVGVITLPLSSYSLTTANCGGSIVSAGETILSRGVCWSLAPNPTIALNTKTIDGNGIGSFTSSITGLNPGTTYHVRAYATSSAGTVYGNDLNFTTSVALAVGQSYQGGIIAYILQPGDPGYDANVPHGLIAAPSDQSTGAQWGCYGTAISGADGIAIGTGNQNTIDIMNGCGSAGIAARICGDLVLNGYSDWYLPSYNELYKLYLNRTAIGGFGGAYYWSSSEINNLQAYLVILNYPNPYIYDYSKNKANYFVRAVRAF